MLLLPSIFLIATSAITRASPTRWPSSLNITNTSDVSVLDGPATPYQASPLPDPATLKQNLNDTTKPADEHEFDIEWFGEVQPGVNMTLYGDIDTIMDQILAINPDYHNWTHSPEHPEYKERFLTSSDSPPDIFGQHTARNDTLPHAKREFDTIRRGDCSTYAFARPGTARQQARDLHDDLGGECKVRASSSMRMRCKNKAAIYLRNHRPYANHDRCWVMGNYALWITNECPSHDQSWDGNVSGEVFDMRGYSVVVAYGDCEDGQDVDPNDYPRPGPLVNAYPKVECKGCVYETAGF